MFFLLSLLTIFRAPTSLIWYLSILVTEFCWIFFCIVLLLVFWRFGNEKYNLAVSVLGIVSLALFSLPVIGAYRISGELNKNFDSAFPGSNRQATAGSTTSNEATKNSRYLSSPFRAGASPFNLLQMFTGINAQPTAYKTHTFDEAKKLTLDFYRSAKAGKQPCVVVVHGGSWAGGDSRQLPGLNSYLAKKGYQVVSINYRLAPEHKFPSPVEDVGAALNYLRTNAENLSIDTGNFVLLGRSAGGQIVLSAAYILRDPSIKGVISFYGPADMVWGYANPTNPLVLNSRKVMEDYLGGTIKEVPQQYTSSSATETVTAQSPPALLIHGKNDPLVSHLHAERLSSKLQAAGTKHFKLYLPWATHGFDYTLNGPGGQLSTFAVERFLQVVAR
ncbi:MAG: Alpha/beta hydrolase [Segetibacter sp.]|nr:Alpha/beta hydrolase [Segetibacter sp.]